MTTKNDIFRLYPSFERVYQLAKIANLSIQVHYSSLYSSGSKDYKLIKQLFDDIEFGENGYIVYSMREPENNAKGSTIEDLNKHISKYKPVNNLDLDGASLSLLNRACERLKLSIEQRDKIIHLASILAGMAQYVNIKCEHIAEGLFYTHTSEDVCAENSVINIGGILIPQHYIEIEDIKKAIKHLESKLSDIF